MKANGPVWDDRFNAGYDAAEMEFHAGITDADLYYTHNRRDYVNKEDRSDFYLQGFDLARLTA